ncbi:serine hydrolase domain-containing protein [Stenotrophomonas maltophilia group sp. Smal35]|uniref:serine hydrolase domain-containing protein n=1 Tax=Stenotrophomonas maltophilia group sp. Smal35 TaxID=3377163 RepID=UPI002553FE0A|nr:serine hydrolase domain-containing protein [Stenotrophomonas maltophilia]
MRPAAALFAVVLGLLPLASSAAPVLTPPDAGIDGLMQAYDGQVPGAAVLVLHDGQPVFRRGYGLAVVEDGSAVTAASNFRLASVSKQFTAAAVLLLVEDGRLGLDQPARQWLPELPPAAATITIRQVHDADVLTLLSHEDRLNFAPGTQYRYSNSGFALLALIVGRASGQDFASFLQQRIFRPLGMAHTVAHQDGVDTVAARAYGYSWIDGRWQRTDQSTTSAVLGDGGIYSSLDDLARWDAALYDDRLLSRASRRAMFSPATATPEPDVPHYGFGWRLNGPVQWHSGESIGFRNVIVRHPEKHLTVIVLTNRNDPEPYPLAQKIAQRWLDTLQ